MFKVSDDGKLRVRDPLHKRFEGSRVKALDYVIEVNGNAMDPQGLLSACVSDEAIELKLQRDRNSKKTEHKHSTASSYSRFPYRTHNPSQKTGLPHGRPAQGAVAHRSKSGSGGDRGAEWDGLEHAVRADF